MHHLAPLLQHLLLHDLLSNLHLGREVLPSLCPPLLNILGGVALDYPVVEAGQVLVHDVLLQDVLMRRVATAVNATGGVLGHVHLVLSSTANHLLTHVTEICLAALLSEERKLLNTVIITSNII